MNEYVDIVDEHDIVIGQELRSRKYSLGFISRVAIILIRDSEQRFIICRRAHHKKVNPDLWDASACGAIKAGETYLDGAIRELEEELGIKCPLKFIKKLYKEDDKPFVRKSFVGIFSGISDTNPVLNHELSAFRKVTLTELDKWVQETPDQFCPGFLLEYATVRELL